MKYEQAKTFNEAAKVAKKKEVNMEEIPRSIMQSMAKAIQCSTELEPQKHLKVSS
jgi:hypothetical protein